MNKYGFVRVAAVAPELKVADTLFNAAKIIEVAKELADKKCQIAVFPEMCITGYSCADLFFQERLLHGAIGAMNEIRVKTADSGLVVVVGLPLEMGGKLYNTAFVLAGGYVVGIVPKTYLPNRNEFYEERWFTSGKTLLKPKLNDVPFGTDVMFQVCNEDVNFRMGCEICEDLWAPIPPSSALAVAGATLLVNPSASDALIGKTEYRAELVKQQSARTLSAYVYASAGPCESTTDLVYSGHLMIAENGTMLKEQREYEFGTTYIMADVDVAKLTGERLRNSSFAKTDAQEYRTRNLKITENNEKRVLRNIQKNPFVPGNPAERDARCAEIFKIQATGLAKRLRHMHQRKVVLGLSGGLDSTLTLLVCVEALAREGFDLKGVKAISMPGFGTSGRTKGNSEKLAEALGVDFRTIPISAAVLQHFKDIGHDPEVRDLVYENCQARERTKILMDLANTYETMVVGTGDMSELALGWCSYNADHMSMYNVNVGIPKTLVRYLVEWSATMARLKGAPTVADILMDICNTPVSPELLPPDAQGNITQKTEEMVGPYELHDFFLFQVVRYGFPPEKVRFLAEQAFEGIYKPDEIQKWLSVFYKRFFSQQFKRSCLPDGPKVGSVALSPRGDWRMPSDAESTLWVK